MKTTKWFALLAATVFLALVGRTQPPAPTVSNAPAPPSPPAAVPTNLSPATVEVVKLAESGVGDDVILAYIQNSQIAFGLSTDQVLYLRDLGLSSQAITAMLNRDTALHPQSFPPVTPPPTQQPATPPPAPEPAPAEPSNAPGPTYVSSPPPEVNYFYTDLAPYGTWVALPGYGWCWQPRACVVNRAWRPYCDAGHWIYTDCGWSWASTYSWGWAPFHYGRWVTYSGCGWVWVPGTVWAPAWVTWRVAGDHCGWAPLPPGASFAVNTGWRYNGVSVGVGFSFGLPVSSYTFVGVNNFTASSVAVHALPPTQVTKIYNQTTVINSTTVNNNIIVNKGVPVSRVAAVTHTEIRPVKIQDAPAGMSRTTTVQTFSKNNTVVYRPQLKAPPKAVAATAQQVDERHPVVYHQPVTTSSSARTTQAPGNVWAPQGSSLSSASGSAGRSQFQNPGPSKSISEKSSPHGPAYSAPKSSQAAPPASASVASAAAQPAEAPKPSADSSATPKADSSRQASPWYGTSSRSAKSIQSSPQGQGSRFYQPKGYYQANEGRASSGSGQRQVSPPPSSSAGQPPSK